MAITINTPSAVDASGGRPLDIVKLSATLSMVIYEDSASGWLLKARTVTIGDPPTVNAEVNVDTASSSGNNYAVLVGLTATSAMVIYAAAGVTTFKARVLTVSGTTITVNAAATLSETSQSATSACFITSAKVLYCYNIGSTGCRAVILSVSGTTITENSIIAVQSGVTFGEKCAAFSATRAVVSWTTTLREGRGIAISGNTLTTPSAKRTIVTGPSASAEDHYFTTELSSTKLVSGAMDGAANRVVYNVLTLNGTDFDVGADSVKVLTDFDYIAAAKLTDTSLVIANNEPTNTMLVEQFNLSGGGSDELTSAGSDTLVLGGFLANMAAAPVDSAQIIIHYWGASTSVVTVGSAAATAFRFIGFAADNENLYASGLKDAATLQLFDYDLPTLTEAGTASFGSGTDGELDASTRGIFPVVKAMADQVLYLRGRDGNDVQVQYNDQNGTLGWVDIGPGTATWGTAKYAAALLTVPTYTDDIIATFSDDDVYRTRFGTATWVKMGDAGSGLRAAVRHPNRFNEILVGGTAAGTVEWSNNFGATFGDVSGTALGTINAFEVSL